MHTITAQGARWRFTPEYLAQQGGAIVEQPAMRQVLAYRIVDSHTGRQLGRDYTPAMRNAARRRADRLDLDYGAARYVVAIVWDT